MEKRIFVVGCARSGTTLVQAMLGSHSSIHAFPETFFFLDSQRPPRPSRSLLNPVRRLRIAQHAYHSAMRRIGGDYRQPRIWWSPSRTARQFIRHLDAVASAAGAPVWSEKTPGHINCIEGIRGLLPDAVFVHVLRDGRDVVASLEHLYREKTLAQAGPVSAWPLHESIQRWNRAVGISLDYAGRPNHFLLDYESLLAAPEATLSRLCEGLELRFEPEMTQYYRNADGVLGRDIRDSWRTDVLSPLRSTHLAKYRALFSEDEQRRLEALLTNRGRIEAP